MFLLKGEIKRENIKSHECLFIIRWLFPGIKDKYLTSIFRKVYKTKCNSKHTRGLCKESLCIVIKLYKTSVNLDLKSISNVLRMKKVDPCLPEKHLRALLEDCLP